MQIVSNILEARSKIAEYKNNKLKVGLVPTMGALHIGHESLIKEAESKCDVVVVSIFVNPIQFGPGEDFDKYPRILELDSKICEKHGVGFIFAPEPKEIYPDAVGSFLDNLTLVVPPSGFQDKLCGKSRNGHFNGVATVVLKLLNIIQPDIAFFGQKDAQQLLIIKKMVKDLNLPVEIIGCPIIRDMDGLACSSRNKYLSKEEREKALSLNKILNHINSEYKQSKLIVQEVLEDTLKLLPDGVELEYLEVLDDSLKNINKFEDGALVAIAAKIGSTRLIDNIIL